MAMNKVGKCGWDVEPVGDGQRYEVILPLGNNEVALPVPRDIDGAPNFDAMQEILMDALIALNKAREAHTGIPWTKGYES